MNREIFEMKIVGTHKGGLVSEWIEEQGVEIIEIGDFSGPFHWEKHKKVQKIIKDYKPHIVHGAVYEGVTMAAINGFLKKVPIIILEETSDPQNRSAKASFLLRIFSLVADKYVAIAPSVLEYLVNQVKVAPRKAICINNGIEIPRKVSNEEIERFRSKFGIIPDDIVIGAVGRFMNQHKRFSDLIEALLQVENDRIKLLMVGSGKDEDYLKSMVEELNLQKKVIFAGYHYDTAPFYKLMDIFCVPSAYEGFGLVAAEAMMHSLPVIATKVGGLKEVIVEGETGFLVSPYSPNLLALKIQYLVENPAQRRRMGEMGCLRAMENFSAERYCKDVEDLYLELLRNEGIFN
ncbi:glycosyltransferase [Litoribacter ruber]|nr:glycosyltransferase [Litoribacter ruber]